MTDPQDGPSLAGLFRRFAQAHLVLSREESRTCGKLCEVAKSYLTSRAKALVASCADRAILFAYSSDSTPMLLKQTFVGRVDEEHRVSRRAGQANDLLCQRAFVKSTDTLGRPLVVPVYRDPVPLTKGRSALHEFAACCQFFPLLRRLGARAVIVSAYTFDRALQAPLERLVKRRHGLYYETVAEAAETPGSVWLEAATDWVVSLGCANRDSQNSFRWGLMSVTGDSEGVARKLHIGVESVRNGYDLLHAHLRQFVSSSVVFQEHAADPTEAGR